MFSYEWFSRYALIEKLKRNVTSKGTETQTNEVTAIAWCTLSNTAYTCMFKWFGTDTVYTLKANFKSLNLPTFKQYEQHLFVFSRISDV